MRTASGSEDGENVGVDVVEDAEAEGSDDDGVVRGALDVSVGCDERGGAAVGGAGCVVTIVPIAGGANDAARATKKPITVVPMQTASAAMTSFEMPPDDPGSSATGTSCAAGMTIGSVST